MFKMAQVAHYSAPSSERQRSSNLHLLMQARTTSTPAYAPQPKMAQSKMTQSASTKPSRPDAAPALMAPQSSSQATALTTALPPRLLAAPSNTAVSPIQTATATTTTATTTATTPNRDPTIKSPIRPVGTIAATPMILLRKQNETAAAGRNTDADASAITDANPSISRASVAPPQVMRPPSVFGNLALGDYKYDHAQESKWPRGAAVHLPAVARHKDDGSSSRIHLRLHDQQQHKQQNQQQLQQNMHMAIDNTPARPASPSMLQPTVDSLASSFAKSNYFGAGPCAHDTGTSTDPASSAAPQSHTAPRLTVAQSSVSLPDIPVDTSEDVTDESCFITEQQQPNECDSTSPSSVALHNVNHNSQPRPLETSSEYHSQQHCLHKRHSTAPQPVPSDPATVNVDANDNNAVVRGIVDDSNLATTATTTTAATATATGKKQHAGGGKKKKQINFYSAIGSLENPSSFGSLKERIKKRQIREFSNRSLLAPRQVQDAQQQQKEPQKHLLDQFASATSSNTAAAQSRTSSSMAGAAATTITPAQLKSNLKANARFVSNAHKQQADRDHAIAPEVQRKQDARPETSAIHKSQNPHGRKKSSNIFRPSSDAYTPRMGRKKIEYKPAEMRSGTHQNTDSLGTLQRPNFRDALKRVAMIIHQHIAKIEHRFESGRERILGNKSSSLFKHSMRELFCEDNYRTPTYKCTIVRIPMARAGMVYGLRKIKVKHEIPSEREIYEFAHQLFDSVQLSSECSIICLIYVERLMEVAKVPLLASTWRPIFMCGLLLASKVWQDLSSWNVEFASVYPQFSVDAINKLELNFLRMVKWDLHIRSSLYAKYYFALRGLVERRDFRQRYNRMMVGGVAHAQALEIQHRTELVKEEAINQLSRSM